jgi:hypothetical protein
MVLILVRWLRPGLVPFFAIFMLLSPSANAEDSVIVDHSKLYQDQLVVGAYHICKILNHEVSCWGINHFGQFGNGNTASQEVSTRLPDWPKDLINGAAGLMFTCFHNPTQVHCAGRVGKFNSMKPALLFEGKNKIKKLVGSHLGLCILFEDSGTVPRCFGKIESADLESIEIPLPVTDLSVGANQFCVIIKNEIQCLQEFKPKPIWKKMEFKGRTDAWIELASGANHSCAIRSAKNDCLSA